MADFSLSPLSDQSFSLNQNVIKNLTTYEEFLSVYLQLEEASTAFSWMKADILLELENRFGDKSFTELSKDIKQPRSTINSYARTARAFPSDKRDPMASFTTCFVASFADPYDNKTKTFLSDTRFEWVEKSVDGGWSSRTLQENISNAKLELEDSSLAAQRQDAEEKVDFIIGLLKKLLREASYEEINNIYSRVRTNDSS